ncbi:Hypothetical predicted protein, partial [Paramuricea clavata]
MLPVIQAEVLGQEGKRRKANILLHYGAQNNSVHHITAIGIPSISDNVASVDVGKVSEKLGLEGRKIVRGNGPIDILIGINHAKMHTAAVEEKEVNTERRKTPVVCTVSTTKEAICCTNFSSWRKLVRVTARIQKLGAKVRSKREGSNATIETENDGTLTPNDLYKAEVYWIKQAQKGIHSRIKNGELK